MKKTFLVALAFAMAPACGAFAACIDYSDTSKAAADASVAPLAPLGPLDAGRDAPPPAVDASSPCASRSYRGGAAGEVVCPGTTRCACDGEEICCMASIDALEGACVSLSACRALALQCDGPEDCDGGVCCLEDRSGGGASCKSAASCAAGQWLCRSDADCAGAPAGPHSIPLDLGTVGADDRGLDGIVGACAK